jgi:sterol 3beta-glucosyltransferase
MADQPYWGRRVRALGAGPSPLPRHKVTAASLAGALAALTGDAGMRARARAVATAVRAEDGVGEAVRLIRGFVAP